MPSFQSCWTTRYSIEKLFANPTRLVVQFSSGSPLEPVELPGRFTLKLDGRDVELNSANFNGGESAYEVSESALNWIADQSVTISLERLANIHVVLTQTIVAGFTVRVAAVLNGVTGAWSEEVTLPTTTVTIAGGTSVDEGESDANTRTGSTLGYTLTFSEPVTEPVTVYYAYVKAGTTATSGQDFVYHVNSEVVHSGPLFDRLNSDELGQIGAWEIPVAAGSPVSTAILPVTVYGDHRLEPDETVQTRMLGVENAALGSTLTATNTIRNDDELPELIVGEPRSVYEGNTVEVDVWLSAATETAVTVQYHDLLTGTAVAGGSGTGDYPLNRLGTEASPNTLTFDPPGAVPQTVSIWAKNDDEVEGDENINLRFHSAVNATLRGADGSGNLDVTATILDEDLRPIVTITSGPVVAAGADAEFTLIAQPAPTTDLTVHLEIDATAGYVAPANLGGKTVTIPANQPTATYSVATIDGDVTSTSGGVRVTLQPDSAAATPATASYTRGAANEATVTVGDSNSPAVIVSDAVLTVGENGGTATYTVKLNNPASVRQSDRRAVHQRRQFHHRVASIH